MDADAASIAAQRQTTDDLWQACHDERNASTLIPLPPLFDSPSWGRYVEATVALRAARGERDRAAREADAAGPL